MIELIKDESSIPRGISLGSEIGELADPEATKKGIFKDRVLSWNASGKLRASDQPRSGCKATMDRQSREVSDAVGEKPSTEQPGNGILYGMGSVAREE
jgi:hypothetical protein